MAMRNNAPLSLALLAMIVLFASHAYAENIRDADEDAEPETNSPFCPQNKHKLLCDSLVYGTRTWEAAMNKALLRTIEEVSKYSLLLNDVEKKLPSTLNPANKKSILDTCTKSKTSVLGILNKSLALIQKDPKFRLPSMLSVAQKSSMACKYALAKFKISIDEASRYSSTASLYVKSASLVAETKPKSLINKPVTDNKKPKASTKGGANKKPKASSKPAVAPIQAKSFPKRG